MCRTGGFVAFTGSYCYLHILHEDLGRHAHLQHPVDDQLAIGRQHVSAPVELLQPLQLTVFTG